MRSEQGEKRAKEIRAEYNRENMRTLAANLKKDDAERFKEIVKRSGMTVHSALSDYVKAVNAAGDLNVFSEERPGRIVPPECVRLTARNFDKLKHEAAFHNPDGLNPNELLNKILAVYFKSMKELRGEA